MYSKNNYYTTLHYIIKAAIRIVLHWIAWLHSKNEYENSPFSIFKLIYNVLFLTKVFTNRYQMVTKVCIYFNKRTNM